MFDEAAWNALLTAAGWIPARSCAVLSVGSVARGWANARSDYDFSVIVASAAPPPATASTISVPLHVPTVHVVVDYIDGNRCELKYWTDSQVDEMFSKVGPDWFEAGRGGATLTQVEEVFLERLATAVAVRGAEWLARRRAELDNSSFRELVVVRSLNSADGAVEDALGQLEADDLHSAVLSAHLAWQYTVDALLEGAGCYGSRSAKWRARRMHDTAPQQLTFDEYWSVETMAGLDPAHPHQWVQSVVARCKQIAMEIDI